MHSPTTASGLQNILEGRLKLEKPVSRGVMCPGTRWGLAGAVMSTGGSPGGHGMPVTCAPKGDLDQREASLPTLPGVAAHSGSREN